MYDVMIMMVFRSLIYRKVQLGGRRVPSGTDHSVGAGDAGGEKLASHLRYQPLHDLYYSDENLKRDLPSEDEYEK